MNLRTLSSPAGRLPALGLCLLTLLWASPGESQQAACGKRSDIVKHLATNYEEVQVARGLSDSEGLVEIFASKDGATFSVLYSLPNGMSCLTATGTEWQTVAPKKNTGPAL